MHPRVRRWNLSDHGLHKHHQQGVHSMSCEFLLHRRHFHCKLHGSLCCRNIRDHGVHKHDQSTMLRLSARFILHRRRRHGCVRGHVCCWHISDSSLQQHDQQSMCDMSCKFILHGWHSNGCMQPTLRQWHIPDHRLHELDQPGLLDMSCEFLLPRRHGDMHSSLLRRVLRVNAVHEHIQSGLLCVHKRAAKCNLHGFWNHFAGLSMDVQCKVLQRRQHVRRLSCQQLVLGQRQKHVPHQHGIKCTFFEPKPVLVQAWPLWKRVAHWNQPVSNLPRGKLLPRWKQQRHDPMPSEFHLRRRSLRTGAMLLQARVPARGWQVSSVPCWRILRKRRAQSLSSQLIFARGLKHSFIVSMRGRIPRLKRCLCHMSS